MTSRPVWWLAPHFQSVQWGFDLNRSTALPSVRIGAEPLRVSPTGRWWKERKKSFPTCLSFSRKQKWKQVHMAKGGGGLSGHVFVSGLCQCLNIMRLKTGLLIETLVWTEKTGDKRCGLMFGFEALVRKAKNWSLPFPPVSSSHSHVFFVSAASSYLSHLHGMPNLHTYELKRKGICELEEKKWEERQDMQAGGCWWKEMKKEALSGGSCFPNPSLLLPFFHSLFPPPFYFSSFSLSILFLPFRSHLRESLQRPH